MLLRENDLFETPEIAIQAFERVHRLQVTIHDLVGTLWPFLSPERFQHSHPLCQAVKVLHPTRCVEFGVTRMRRELPQYPHGRVHICFAGLVECVVPVFRQENLEWVIFAGPRLAGPNLQQAVRDTQPAAKSLWPAGTGMPSRVNDAEAQRILESLRQLAARLRLWEIECQESGVQKPGRSTLPRPGAYSDYLARRRALINSIIRMRHTKPLRIADIAAALKLSPSRTAHAVKEACGRTFIELLTEARLRTAASLLLHTDYSILDIALRSGFGDVSQLHRIFRRRFRVSPLKYRKQFNPV
jgi:AraC-like DNA-binding protein